MKFKIIIFILLIMFQKSESAEFEKDIFNEPEPNMKFLFAVEKGNIELVKHFLNQKEIDINSKDTNSLNCGALHKAITNKHNKIIELLLNTPGINVDIQESCGLTPLMLAVSFNHFNRDLAELLLQKGADVNVRNYRGSTALELSNLMNSLFQDWQKYGEKYKEYRNDLIRFRFLFFAHLMNKYEKFKLFENKINLLPALPREIAKTIVEFVIINDPVMKFSQWVEIFKSKIESKNKFLPDYCIIS